MPRVPAPAITICEQRVPGPGGLSLVADLQRPAEARALILMAHGSGSGRFSPRNRTVAARLQQSGMATLLMDLLTPAEAAEDGTKGALGCAIPLLGQRLAACIDWAASQPELQGLPLGLFGSSTGAAAALTAAVLRPRSVGAVVSRGGRPDLAPAALPLLRCPLLLIVGERDREVLRCNQWAALALRAPHRLVPIPGAGHLFEERGALQAVAELAAGWFAGHLDPPAEMGTSHFHIRD